jgi:protein ImuB
LATAHLWQRPNGGSSFDAQHDAALLADIKTTERLAHWCGRYTPWTAMDDTGGVWLDISGCQHLFGGERGLLDDLISRIRAQGYAVVAAVADTPGAAWAAARFADGVSDGTAVIIESGAQRELLSPLPIAALRLEASAAEGLRRLGLRRVGDLYPMARAPLAARYGSDVLKRLDQALGVREEPVSPIRPVPSNRVRMTFPDPVGLHDDLWAGFGRLLDALVQRLSDSSLGARCLELSGYRADGTLSRLVIGLGQASRDADHIRRLVQEKFDAFDPGFGIEVMTLSATSTEPLTPKQHDLTGESAAAEDLARLRDRLANRLGPDQLGHVGCAESHLPERAVTKSSDPVSAVMKAEAFEVPALPRPLHLLNKPEPVDAIAPVPDGPPAVFRWRRQAYRVRHSDGPERLAPEWWRDDPERLVSTQSRARDYYQVEDETGSRYWLFRSGLYRPDVPPRWYLHGVFA